MPLYLIQILNMDIHKAGQVFTLCEDHMEAMRDRLQRKGFNGVVEVKGISIDECSHCKGKK